MVIETDDVIAIDPVTGEVAAETRRESRERGAAGDEWIKNAAHAISLIERDTWRDSEDLARLVFQIIVSAQRQARLREENRKLRVHAEAERMSSAIRESKVY